MTRHRDARDLEVTTDSPTSVRGYDAAIAQFATYHGDPLTQIESVLAEDPDFVSGHCLRAAAAVVATERAALPLLRDALAHGRRLAHRANERERQHFAAASAWLDGDFHRAMALYGDIAFNYPRDQLALQVAHIGDFSLGQQRLLRDRIAVALTSWDADVPGYSHLLGMIAFGLEETNLFGQAEQAARRALAADPSDAWAAHALAHVFESTGRIVEGIQLLEAPFARWAEDNALAYHNFWHLALYYIERGEYAQAVRLYDTRVWPKASRISLEMVDAAALLFRLFLRGADLGKRATRLADAWSNPEYRGYYAYCDVHAVMAMVVAGRLKLARSIVDELARAAAGVSSNAMMVRNVGLPFAQALLAFAEDRHDEAIRILMPLRQHAYQFGGSNAQREIIEQILGASARRSKNLRLATALAAERRILRPDSPWARTLCADL